MILGVVAVVLIIFLIFRTVSLSSKLEEVQNQLTQSQDYKQKYEDMQLENMQLQEKLDGKDTKTTGNSDTADTKVDTKKDTKKDTASTSSGTKEYTVKTVIPCGQLPRASLAMARNIRRFWMPTA